MALSSKSREGGLLDVIRCDQPEYLIWKWRPSGAANTTKKENAIRWGSSLRVKDGEVAAFVYDQRNGPMQDFIEGPHDDIIKTANFPVISNIIGLAYAGGSPFQAEVYFINMAGIIQLKFGVPYFDVYDPRFLDFSVPVAARGSISFNITDYKSFVKLHRMIEFDLDRFKNQVKDALTKLIKGIITNIPHEENMPALQLERKVLEINDLIEPRLRSALESDFGVNLKRFDLSTIEFDKESAEYQRLMTVTRQQQEKTTVAQTDVGIQNLQDTQRINAQNMEDTLRIQREEVQRAQKLTTEGLHLTAHQLNQQTEVAKKAAESMGTMGHGDGAGGIDPGSMMASMAMGGAVGSGMAGMMGSMMQGMNDQRNTPPPAPPLAYLVAVGGKQAGPYGLEQLGQFVASGEFTQQTYVWKQGMANWERAGNVQELAQLFQSSTPPPPPAE